MDFIQRICKLVSDVCNGFFYLFVDLNLPALKKDKDGNEESYFGNSDLNRRLFECPGCQEIPEPPVFTCSSGHIVCTVCKGAGKCSVCGGDYLGNARNFIVERIVTTNTFPCRFDDEGCDQVLKVSELLEHQAQCFHRHCNCGIIGKNCDGKWVGSVNDLYAHLVISHEMFYVFRDKKATLKAEFDLTSKTFLRFDGPTVMLKVIQGKNYMIRTVYKEELNIVFTFIVGLYRDEGSSTSPEFIYKRATTSIKLLQRDALGAAQTPTRSERVWIGPVNTVDDKLEDIFEEDRGLLLPWSELLGTSDLSGRFLTWDLQINVYPPKEVPSEDSSQQSRTAKQKLKELLCFLLKPFLMSTWAIVAPGFTLVVMLFFVCFV